MGNYGTIIIIHQNSIEHSGQQSTAKQCITCDLFSSIDDPPCHKVEDTGDGALVSARLGWQPPPPPACPGAKSSALATGSRTSDYSNLR